MLKKEESNKKFRIHTKGYEAVILYPALVTPALVEPGGCLTVILALKDAFKDKKMPSVPPKGEIGAEAARVLHSQLILIAWGDEAISSTNDVPYAAQKRQGIAQRHMIYADHMEAVDEYGGNYRGWYLEELREEDFLVEGFDAEGNPKKWGVIHRGAARMHLAEGREFKHLVQLNFKGFSKAGIPGMYELSCVCFKLYDDEADNSPEARRTDGSPAGEDSCERPMRCCYTEPDDDMLNDHFKKDKLEQKPQLLRKEGKIQAKIIGGDEMFRLYDDSRKGITVTRPDGSTDVVDIEYVRNNHGPLLQFRHPVYIPADWKGRVGVVGDLHASSRQCLYPLANTQVIPGADPEHSPYLGRIVHQNLPSATTLMREIAKESDILAVVGDLYDHSRNCDPRMFMDTVRNTGQLWDAMAYNKKYLENYNAYPKSIDGLLLLSRILDIYKDGKPVVYVSGNHEGYEHSYGVSPRVRISDGIQIKRANEDIAAEHNLTFYEASLLYGKGACDLGLEFEPELVPESDVVTRNLKFNFRPENFDWVYCLYTPWKDCVIPYGEKENFICLGWGSKENFLEPGFLNEAGYLPWAEEACSQAQLGLTKWAVEQSGAEKNILLSHFTFVCYDQKLPLNNKAAVVKTNDAGFGKYSIGSFYKNRQALYRMLRSGGLSYAVCGHGHRSGAYACGPPGGPGKLTVTGTAGSRNVLDKSPFALGEHNILVCGASGPFSRQNHTGELAGFGMDFPQGCVLNISNNTLAWKRDLRTKPRLAVVMDYLWHVGKIRPFILDSKTPEREKEESCIHQDYDGTLYFQLSEKFKALFSKTQQHPFRKINLIAVGKDNMAMLSMYPEPVESINKKRGGGTFPVFNLRLGEGGLSAFKKVTKADTEIIAYFLSISFSSVPGVVDADHYDLHTPWCFPVKIEGDYKRIFRPSDKRGGELPDYEWYEETWEEEYKVKR
ncbi:MAG: metallophosphoesterase [Desulfovibrio sp.]|jgi:hypothetical protein|nr:metallophosphoesterase [Desulfovibrio sp.]